MANTYTTYKDSGILWIGEIPEHWNIAKTLFMLDQPITDGPHETPIAVDDGIPFISAEAVSSGEIDFSHKWGNISKEYYEECSKKYIPQLDDIYMIKSGASTGRTAIVKTTEPFTIWSPLAVFRANKERITPLFLLYVLRSEPYQKQVETKWSYGTQQNIGMRTLEQLAIPYPRNLSEQESIANFLDEKCSEIDELISLQEKMIDELKEYKQSVITEAVTKGLDRNVKMKDSGVNWIGEIPEHWEIRRIKNIGTSKNGITYSPSEMVSETEGVLVLRSSNIQNGKLRYDDNVYVSTEIPQSLFVKVGDIIICSRNGSASLVGKCAIVEENIIATFGAFMMRFQSDYNSKYIFYLLSCAISQYKQLFSTTTINQLTVGVFGSLKMPFIHSNNEQEQIALFLDSKCSQIDSLISIKENKIEELKDYKKSLIYEYVTGKKRV